MPALNVDGYWLFPVRSEPDIEPSTHALLQIYLAGHVQIPPRATIATIVSPGNLSRLTNDHSSDRLYDPHLSITSVCDRGFPVLRRGCTRRGITGPLFHGP